MRKEYVKPMMVGETFKPNEYCSSCGATGEKVYKFICDAPSGTVYLDDGDYIGSYGPCSATHTVTVTDESELPFYDGFVDRNSNGKEDEGEDAIIWLEKETYDIFGYPYTKIVNWHASAQYKDISQIEVARS